MREVQSNEISAKELLPVWLVGLTIGLILSLYAVFLYPTNEWDTIRRYAPMAEEFANGNWRYAFHPRFGLCFQTLTGILVFLTKMSGLAACQTVGTFAWTLSTIPIWSAIRRSFGREAAWWAVLLVLLSPTFFDLAVNGWRDDVRILVVALWTLGVVRIGSWWGVAWMALGLLMGTTLREDALPFSCLVCGGYTIALWLRKAFFKSLIPLGATILGVLGVCTMVCFYTGYFVPSQKLVSLLTAHAPSGVVEAVAASTAPVVTSEAVVNAFEPTFEVMKPSFLILSVVALCMALFRLWRRQFGRFDIAVLIFAFGGSLYLYAANFFISGDWGSYWRYHYPAYAPLAAYPAAILATILASRPRLRIAATALMMLVVTYFVIMEIYRPVKHARKPERYALMAQYAGCCWAAERIKSDWCGPARDERPFSLLEYNTNRRPYVAAFWPLVGYRAGGRPFVDHIRRGEEIIPDYWLEVSGAEYEEISTKYVFDSNLDAEKELVDSHHVKNYEFKLYRHVEAKGAE